MTHTMPTNDAPINITTGGMVLDRSLYQLPVLVGDKNSPNSSPTLILYDSSVSWSFLYPFSSKRSTCCHLLNSGGMSHTLSLTGMTNTPLLLDALTSMARAISVCV